MLAVDFIPRLNFIWWRACEWIMSFCSWAHSAKRCHGERNELVQHRIPTRIRRVCTSTHH